MSFLDKAKAAARKAVDQHGDKARDATNRAGDALDKRTGGEHSDTIRKGTKKVQDALDKFDGKDDDTR